MPSERDEVRGQSLELLFRAYDEIQVGLESLNSRAGLALALIAAAATGSSFEAWSFENSSSRETILNWVFYILNALSLGLFICGTIRVTRSLIARTAKTPYDIDALRSQEDYVSGSKDNLYSTVSTFQRRQLGNTAAAIAEAHGVLQRKARHFNRGIVLILCSIAFLILVKIIF